MPVKINVAGTWKDATVKINVAGTWKTATVWHNVSGTWKNLSSAPSASLPANMYPEENYTASANLKIKTDGTWSYTFTPTTGTWMNSGSASDYEVRLTQTGGSTITGESLSTWLACSTERNWYLTSAEFDKSATATLEIRMAASPFTVLATSTVNFYCHGIL